MPDEHYTESNQDDVEIVEESGGRTSFRSPDLARVKDALQQCQAERQEYLDGWQRAKADFVNASREHEKMRVDLVKYASQRTLESFLPIADSFDIAFANKEAWGKVDATWRTGVEYIYANLVKTFEENSLVRYGASGEMFDPALHESVETVAVDDVSKDGMIVEVIARGYTLHDKVIRPARVRVGAFHS